jgi:hypothetical protein
MHHWIRSSTLYSADFCKGSEHWGQSLDYTRYTSAVVSFAALYVNLPTIVNGSNRNNSLSVAALGGGN